MMCPHTGIKIGLQLGHYRYFIVCPLTHFRLHGISLFQYTQYILYMMSHFMGNNIGYSELPFCTVFFRQLVVKAQVEVNLMVTGTIERTKSRLPDTASGRFDSTIVYR